MKVRVPVFGTVGKSVLIETTPASLADLQAQIASILKGQKAATSHGALSGLQDGDDHPQYTMYSQAETIIAPWAFRIGGTVQWDISAARVNQTVPLYLPDGSALAPSLTNNDDTNTGLAWTAADTLDVATAGVQRFRYGPAGQFGIGTDYGTVGQVARSTGALAAPTWTSLTAPAAGITISTGLTFALANDLSALEALASTGFAARTGTDTWAQRTLTAPAAGFTITNPAGVAGDPTFVLANDLSALEGLGSTGFAARTGPDTWAQRTLTAPAAGFTIANPAGIAGNPTFALADDLSGLEGLTTTGIAVRTAASTWTTRTLTAPAAGFTITNGDGVSGAPTFVLANDLSALEALASTGFAARTGTDAWSQRTLTAPAAGLTISNPAGIAGDPTFALANDIAGVEGLAANGIATRTATDTWTVRTNTGSSNRLTVTNGDGVSGNPTYDIAATYVGQASITTLGTIGTGVWQGTTIGPTFGGTGLTSYTLGDTLYASAANTLAKLAGNTTATKKFLRQTGDGVNSAAPAWDTLVAGDLPALGGNPTQSIGLAVVNGSATTYLRSDGAPALDQGIAPTWTSSHIWTDNDKVLLGTGSDLELFHDGTDSTIKSNTGNLFFAPAAANTSYLESGNGTWGFRITPTEVAGTSGLASTSTGAYIKALLQVPRAASPSNIRQSRVNGSFTVPTTLLSGENVAQNSFLSYNGTTLDTGASYLVTALEDWTASAMGARWQFQTVAIGASALITRLNIAAGLYDNAMTDKGAGTLNFSRVYEGGAEARNRRNHLKNPAFAVAQTATTFAAAADASLTLDSWYVLTQTAAVQVDQVADQFDGARFNIKGTQTQVASQRYGFEQFLLARNCKHLRGQTVQVSLRVRSSATGAVRVNLVEWRGAADAPTVDIVNTWSSGSLTNSNFYVADTNVAHVASTSSGTLTANTWTDITVTGTLGSAFNNLYVLVYNTAVQVTSSTLEVANAHLTLGSTAPVSPFITVDPAEMDYLRIWTSPTGLSILQDNAGVWFGLGGDLEILHDGTNSKITNVTGTLQLKKSSTVLEEQDTNYVDVKVRSRQTGVASPSTLALGSNDNLNVAANIAVVRLTCNTLGSTLSGIANPTAGDELILFNIGATGALTITNEDANSTAANRFALASGTSTVVQPGGSAHFWYDGTTARWRQISRLA